MNPMIASLVALALAPAASAELPTPLSLDWCLERASTSNPEIAADAAASDAAAHRIRTAASLEDPRLQFEASNLPIGDFDLDSTPLSGLQLGLRQKLPVPGLLSNREGAARAGAEAASRSVDDRRLAVASAVESAWAELGFAQRALGITERNIGLLRQLTATAEARYRVGSGLQQDVLRSHVELTVLLEDRLQRDARVVAAAAGLEALLDLPGDTEFPTTSELTEDAPLPPLDRILAGIETGNAQLLALAARVEEAERQVRVAQLEGYPDFDVGVGYRVRRSVRGDPVHGDDFVSAGVTIRLPVDRARWRAHVAERRALARRAKAEYRAARARLVAGVRVAHAELVRATSEGALLETGLVPQAEQSLQSSRSGYEVGQVDFPSLLDTQVQLLDAELRLVRARADRRQRFAALEAAAGEKLR